MQSTSSVTVMGPLKMAESIKLFFLYYIIAELNVAIMLPKKKMMTRRLYTMLLVTILNTQGKNN